MLFCFRGGRAYPGKLLGEVGDSHYIDSIHSIPFIPFIILLSDLSVCLPVCMNHFENRDVHLGWQEGHFRPPAEALSQLHQ